MWAVLGSPYRESRWSRQWKIPTISTCQVGVKANLACWNRARSLAKLRYLLTSSSTTESRERDSFACVVSKPTLQGRRSEDMLVPYIAHVQCTDPGVISCMCEYHTAAYSVFWLKEKQSAVAQYCVFKKHNTLEYGTIHHVIHEIDVLWLHDFQLSFIIWCDKIDFPHICLVSMQLLVFFSVGCQKADKIKTPQT